MKCKMTYHRTRAGWLANRGHGIGGSDAAAVIGANPWMSNVELWEIKTGQRLQDDISNSPAVKFGTQAEASIRRLFELDHPEYRMEYKPNNSWTNDDYPWALASLDGWLTDESGRRGVWECKTTEVMRDRDWDKWKNSIPQNYFCQVLHYMAVTESDFAVLRARIKYIASGEFRWATRDYTILAEDVAEDMRYLMDEEKKFWRLVETKTRPSLILPDLKF